MVQARKGVWRWMIAGMRGEDEAAGRLAQCAETLVLPMRISAVLCGIQFARGVTAIAAGRYDEAFDHLRRVFDRGDPSYQAVQSSWAPGDLAEAAVRAGRAEPARRIIDVFRPGEQDSVTPWTRVALLYAAPLLASGDEAAELFFVVDQNAGELATLADMTAAGRLRVWSARPSRLHRDGMPSSAAGTRGRRVKPSLWPADLLHRSRTCVSGGWCALVTGRTARAFAYAKARRNREGVVIVGSRAGMRRARVACSKA